MKRVLLFIYSFLISLGLFGQHNSIDSLYKKYKVEVINAQKSGNRDLSNLYLDSMDLLGAKYEWETKLLKARVYAFIEDSMKVGQLLISDCITHFSSTKDTAQLLKAYERSLFINQNLYEVDKVISDLSTAINLAQSSRDSNKLAYFHGRLGGFYLNTLQDIPSAVQHLAIALNYSTKIKYWINASQVANHLSQAKLLQKDSLNAKEMIDLSLKYSLQIDSTNTLRYDGYLHQGYFYLEQKNYNKAIKNAMVAYKQSILADDYDLLLLSCDILIPAYWEKQDIDQGLFYANIALELMEGEGSLYDIREIYLYSAKLFEAKGMYQKALKYSEKYHALERTYSNQEHLNAISKFVYKEELERKKIEQTSIKMRLNLMKGVSRLQSIIIGTVVFLLLIVLIFSRFIYKKKQEANQLNKVLSASQEVILKQKEILQKDILGLQQHLEDLNHAPNIYYLTQSAIEVNFEDIIYLESDNNYVLIHVKDRERPFMERAKMIELIKNFPPSLLIKIHRSYYINRNHVLSRPSKYVLIMSNGTKLKASRSFANNLGNSFTHTTQQ